MKLLFLLVALANLISSNGLLFFDNKSNISNENLQITYYKGNRAIAWADLHDRVSHPDEATDFSISDRRESFKSGKMTLERDGQYTIDSEEGVELIN